MAMFVFDLQDKH